MATTYVSKINQIGGSDQYLLKDYDLHQAQAKNVVYAGPSTGSNAAPTFRTLAAADIPSITKSKISDFPTKLSDFTNDSGFISSYTETDPTVPAWAKASSKPSYTASEIGLGNVENKSAATILSELTSSNVTSALGFTPANSNSLDATKLSGTVPTSCLPSYVDDVLEYNAKANFPSSGEAGKIYVDKTTNLTYRWSGSAYVEISPSLALGTTSSTAFRGDYGNSAYTHAVTNKGAAFSSGLYKITTNAEGHVTAATAVTKADITALGIPSESSSYSSLSPASGGTDISLVTTGEKYTWNNKSDFSGSYNDLTNKPTKLSDFTNDSGFITSYTETDPTVPDWAKATNKPSYTASEVGALPTGAQIYGTCSTAAGTAAKTVSNSSYVLTTGGIVAVKFTNSVPANATLNIGSKGAKNIFYNGAKITANIIQAGDLAHFMYDGTQYQLLGIEPKNRTAASSGTAMSLVTTGEKYTWNNKSTVSVTQTLTSGTEIGKITINGTATSLYCNANTDTKVTQAYSTTNNSFPLLMTATSGITSTSSRGDTTSIVNNSLYANPSTGQLNANIINTQKLIGAGSDIYGDTLPSSGVEGQIFFQTAPAAGSSNDYAEYRVGKDIKGACFGRVVVENGDDSLSYSTERLQPGGNIVSDTYGYIIGVVEGLALPIAVAGRVLAYTYESRYEFEPGDAVCTAPNGTVSKMTREEIQEYPDRIIGYVSCVPEYEIWGDNVAVNGRIWIKVK